MATFRPVRSALMSMIMIGACVAASAVSANPITYDVSRTWTDGTATATLTGTVDVAVGSYSVMNQGPAPFTDINLVLTVDGSPFDLTFADTSLITGSGQFLINATASTLIFDTVNFDSTNPADLSFGLRSGDHYTIGSDGVPGFESAFTSAGNPLMLLNLPVIFGTARGNSVPETGSTIWFLAVSLSAIAASKTSSRLRVAHLRRFRG